MQIHFAPLQGYADYVYLRAFAEVYGAADACYSPFIRIEKGVPRRQDMARLERWDGLVPQIIFNGPEEFRALASAIKALGFKKIDLNLGCPFPMQTSRGRGAAMIGNTADMQEIADIIAADKEATYSVKMRLGKDDAGEWRSLLPILNGLALDHVAVHPRVATQMYEGDLRMAEFEALLSESKNKVIYNGDLHTAADIDAIAAAYPAIAGVMIGRGLLVRPSLIEEWRSGKEWDREQRLAAIADLHSRIFEDYAATLCGDAQVLQKIKPFWEYLEPEIGHKAAKQLRKATSLGKYRSVIASIF